MQGKIMIPDGHFESNCSACKFLYNDGNGLYCAMYRKTITRGEMDDKKCPQYKMPLKTKIKIGAFIYFVVAILSLIVEFIMR